MELFVNAVHVVLCILMVLIILLQPGKGGDVGAAFGGGGSSTVFGPRGSAGLLARATTLVAIMFMVTSVLLSKHSGRSETPMTSLEDEQQAIEREMRGDAPEEAPMAPGDVEIAPPGPADEQP